MHFFLCFYLYQNREFEVHDRDAYGCEFSWQCCGRAASAECGYAEQHVRDDNLRAVFDVYLCDRHYRDSTLFHESLQDEGAGRG